MRKQILGTFVIFIFAFEFYTAGRLPGITQGAINGVLSDSTESFVRGKALYKSHCMSCHQFDGGGVDNLNPPLIQTPYVLGSKTGLINIVLKGFKERVDIDGNSYSNNMPPLNYLTDQQIADVLTYVRNDFSNKAALIKASDVKRLRGGR